jgi:hypothetical protein
MNHLFTIVGFAITTALVGSCNSSRHINFQGEAITNVATFWKVENNMDTPYFKLPEKAWYHDSLGITQICRIWFATAADNSKSTYIETMGYRFVDLKKKWAYEYISLSDTASVRRKYRLTDTTLFSGGWNFTHRTSVPFDSFQYLPDTTIDAVIYKQCKVSFVFNKNRWEGIGLLLCDNKNTQFQLNTVISSKTGCRLVSFRQYPIENSHARFDMEVKFISNYLPDSVARVFAAWKRNEKIYPVQ